MIELSKRKRVHNMTLIKKESTQLTGWRRMKEIASKSMAKGNYNIADVKQELKKIRNERSE